MASTLSSENPSRGLDVSWPGLPSQGQVLGPDDLLERLVNGQIAGLWLAVASFPVALLVLP